MIAEIKNIDPKNGEVLLEEKEKSVLEIAAGIYQSYLKEKELAAREQELFVDSMKKATGGNGLVFTNSK